MSLKLAPKLRSPTMFLAHVAQRGVIPAPSLLSRSIRDVRRTSHIYTRTGWWWCWTAFPRLVISSRPRYL